MQLCKECWAKLREAIDARGVGHMVKTRDEVIAGVVSELFQDAKVGKEAKIPVQDPLFLANTLIWNNAIRVAGLELMTANPDGTSKCPICYLAQNCGCGDTEKCPFRGWIDRAADDAVAAVTQGEA